MNPTRSPGPNLNLIPNPNAAGHHCAGRRKLFAPDPVIREGRLAIALVAGGRIRPYEGSVRADGRARARCSAENAGTFEKCTAGLRHGWGPAARRRVCQKLHRSRPR